MTALEREMLRRITSRKHTTPKRLVNGDAFQRAEQLETLRLLEERGVIKRIGRKSYARIPLD